MISTLYIEQAVADHPVSRRICERFPAAARIPIDRYGEVFNRKAQNFRLQKRRPALILAQKFDRHVLPTPAGYGIGQTHNYYVSHMLNCVYDCRYCFLQGMYRSAHYVLFVNFEDFRSAMIETLNQVQSQANADVCFFSGYDCDSLALEPVSGYLADLLPFFEQHENAWLEVRTKSTQVRVLGKRPALPNVVAAFSFTPAETAAELEHKVPSVQRRIDAMVKLAAQGWPPGLRFDPLIYSRDYQSRYRRLFEAVFSALRAIKVVPHSVSLGPFRLPRPFHQTMQRLYPDEPLLALPLAERNGMVSYSADIEQEMRAFCDAELRRYVPPQRLFPCEF